MSILLTDMHLEGSKYCGELGIRVRSFFLQIGSDFLTQCREVTALGICVATCDVKREGEVQ